MLYQSVICTQQEDCQQVNKLTEACMCFFSTVNLFNEHVVLCKEQMCLSSYASLTAASCFSPHLTPPLKMRNVCIIKKVKATANSADCRAGIISVLQAGCWFVFALICCQHSGSAWHLSRDPLRHLLLQATTHLEGWIMSVCVCMNFERYK